MKTKLFGVLASAFLALPVASFANEDISVEIGEITAAHQEKMQAFSKKMQGASREEQRKIYQEEYPDAGPAVAQLTKIVSANPQDAASLDAIAWMLRHSREGLDPAVFEALEKHHLDREELVPVVAGLMRGRSPEAQAFLKTASEKSAQKDVRGMALFARAFLIERLSHARSNLDYPLSSGFPPSLICPCYHHILPAASNARFLSRSLSHRLI